MTSAWRTIPEFPKYQVTESGDVRHRENRRVLQEVQNTSSGVYFYSLWKDGEKHAKSRTWQSLMYSAWPELLSNWRPVPGFDDYLVNISREVMGKRAYKVIKPAPGTNTYRLMRDGKRNYWSTDSLGLNDDWYYQTEVKA